MQVGWVALCTIVSAASAEEKRWFSCARQFHGGVARCLLRTTDMTRKLQMKVAVSSESELSIVAASHPAHWQVDGSELLIRPRQGSFLGPTDMAAIEHGSCEQTQEAADSDLIRLSAGTQVQARIIMMVPRSHWQRCQLVQPVRESYARVACPTGGMPYAKEDAREHEARGRPTGSGISA